MVNTVTPSVAVAQAVVTEPKEIVSGDYQPITDPDNVKRFVADYFADIPIMQKIAACESHDRQYAASGHVIRGEENHFDIGVMQINELYHASTAEKLGLDLYSIDGNVAYARYLYDKYGTRPWLSSSPCWSKDTDLAIARS